MSKLHSKNNKGITLIEVMIVIIIIAVVSLYAITLKRDKQRNEIINRTIVDIKHIQESALNYYSKKGKWPTQLATEYFIPRYATCSSWPSNTTTVPECYQKEVYQGQSFKNYYTVSIKVTDARAAKQIAAKLPQSDVSNTTVKSSIGLPGYYKGGITSAGIVKGYKRAFIGFILRLSGDNLYLPKCPEGYEGHYMEAPQYFTTGFDCHWQPDPVTPFLCSKDDKLGVNIELGYDNTIKARNSSKPFVYAYNHIHSPDTATKSHAYFLTFCLPTEQWKPLSRLNWKMVQCDNDWYDYNSPFGTKC